VTGYFESSIVELLLRIARAEIMTLVDASFRYNLPPGEAEMGALNAARDVYGIRAIRMDERERTLTVEFDASRLSEEQIESLLRRAGVDIEARIALA
jgi:hypothetical protein